MTEQLNNTVTSDNVSTDVVTDTVNTDVNAEVKDVAKEEVVEETPKKDKTAQRFAELAKRENSLRLKERSIKENLSKYQDYEKAKIDAKKNPIAFVQQLTGMSFDDIINLSLTNLDDNKVDPQKKIEEKLAAIEKERAEEKAQAAKYNEDKNWNEHISTVAKYVNENPDTYEVILSHPDRGTQIYRELLDQALKLAKRPLDGDEVITLLKRTESVLTSEVKPLFERLSKSKKFSNKIETIKAEPEKIVTDIKTLTNDLASASSTVSNKKMTDEERMAEIKRKYG